MCLPVRMPLCHSLHPHPHLPVPSPPRFFPYPGFKSRVSTGFHPGSTSFSFALLSMTSSTITTSTLMSHKYSMLFWHFPWVQTWMYFQPASGLFHQDITQVTQVQHALKWSSPYLPETGRNSSTCPGTPSVDQLTDPPTSACRVLCPAKMKLFIVISN